MYNIAPFWLSPFLFVAPMTAGVNVGRHQKIRNNLLLLVLDLCTFFIYLRNIETILTKNGWSHCTVDTCKTRKRQTSFKFDYWMQDRYELKIKIDNFHFLSFQLSFTICLSIGCFINIDCSENCFGIFKVSIKKSKFMLSIQNLTLSNSSIPCEGLIRVKQHWLLTQIDSDAIVWSNVICA